MKILCYYLAGYRIDIKCNNRSQGYLCTYCKNKAMSLPPIDTIFHFMKYTVPPLSQYTSSKSELTDTERIIKKVFYDHYPLKYTVPFNRDSRIPFCSYANTSLDYGCNLFSKVFTTSGIGHVFNNIPFWSLYKESEVNKAFYDHLYEMQPNFEKELPRSVQAHGRDFSLDLTIWHGDRNYFTPDMKEVESVVGDQLHLAVHDPAHVPNILSDGIIIKPGLFYEISVVPTVIWTDKSAISLPVSKRDCYTRKENKKLEVFKAYSQTSCIFECQLRRATNLCNCTLWDYPKVEPSFPTCVDQHAYNIDMLSLSSNVCFNTAMRKPVRPADCDCPNDCSHIQYSIDSKVMALTL